MLFSNKKTLEKVKLLEDKLTRVERENYQLKQKFTMLLNQLNLEEIHHFEHFTIEKKKDSR